MARNGRRGFGRRGSVRGRTQFRNPYTRRWVKRDRATGRFMGQKSTPGPWKGVAREPDRWQD
jgi:hypothetical protein